MKTERKSAGDFLFLFLLKIKSLCALSLSENKVQKWNCLYQKSEMGGGSYIIVLKGTLCYKYFQKMNKTN